MPNTLSSTALLIASEKTPYKTENYISIKIIRLQSIT